MRSVDAEEAMRLDRLFDELLSEPRRGGAEVRSGKGESLDADMAATLRLLLETSTRPSPDPDFVERLRAELTGSDAVVPPVRYEESRRAVNGHGPLANITQVEDHGMRRRMGAGNSVEDSARSSLPIERPLLLHDSHHPPRTDTPPHSWRRHWGIAATILLIVALGGITLLAANPNRRVPPPSRLNAISIESAGAAPRVLGIYDIGVTSLIEPSTPLDESLTPDENIWATGWRDGKAVPMTEPNDPLAVSWLTGSTTLGEGGNVVLQGHNEYWDSDTAVFADLDQLTPGSLIQLSSVNDVTFWYGVQWVVNFPSSVGPNAQREILGPTDKESLTLITPGGGYDAQTGTYAEVVVVRAEHLWTDGLASVEIPDPTPCEVPPRSVAELDALVLRVNGSGRPLPTPTTPDILTGGVPADPVTAAAVTNTARTLAACLNANDGLRSFALYSDDGLLRLFDFSYFSSAFTDPMLDLEWAPDVASLADPATPVPVDDQHVVWDVGDVRILADGRVAAIVNISQSQSSQVPTFWTGEHALYVFTLARDRYFVIDEVVFPVPE